MITYYVMSAARPAEAADAVDAAHALADAFFDDPVFRWAMPDDERRRTALPGVFSLFVEHYLRNATAHVAGSPLVAGAALWAAPGVTAVGEDDGESFGRRLAEVCGPDLGRVEEVSALLEEHHPVEECAYLNFVGVHRRRQGMGIGSGLLTALRYGWDKAGVPAYLEATSDDNRRLYERHGFVASSSISVGGCPPLWPMWREPQ